MVSRWTAIPDPIAPLFYQQLLAAEEKAQPLLTKLDPERRAKIVMALLGVVLTGLALICLAVVCGRYFRRAVRKPVQPTVRHEDEWFRKRLDAADGNRDDESE